MIDFHKLLKENEKLKEQLKLAVEAFIKCANESNRETNGKEQYEQDAYGYILKVCKKALAKLQNSGGGE